VPAFYRGLFIVSASTLSYEIVLTRLLSVISWYYLAFVTVSAAMFGMTAGALFVQLRPQLFPREAAPERTARAAFWMAASMPIALLTALAIPVEVSRSAVTIWSFLLFGAVTAAPFFFSGIAICVSLTQVSDAIGKVYFADLAGAAFGACGSVALLYAFDATSAILAISGLVFTGAAAYASFARASARRAWIFAGVLCSLALVNRSTPYGIQPAWVKGRFDRRGGILTEVWNPISIVRAYRPGVYPAAYWGPSPKAPQVDKRIIQLKIDQDAGTEVLEYAGDPESIRFLRYDVTSLPFQMRRGGTAAIIGMGGGRDVLSAVAMDFRRITAIEINDAIVGLVSKELDPFSGMSKVSGLEIHAEEARSFLSRTPDRFDVIQAALVDTWAATSAGAMTLSENALYTVDAFQIFYERLTPGGILGVSRWYSGHEQAQTYRMVALAWAVLLRSGVAAPGRHLALIRSGSIGTLLLSNRAFSPDDVQRLDAVLAELEFTPLVRPGEAPSIPELRSILACRTLEDLAALRSAGPIDYSPVFDESPFFFNAVRLENITELARTMKHEVGNLRALAFLACSLVATLAILGGTIFLPLSLRSRRERSASILTAVGYFVLVGLGFMLVEIAMMQQLSVYLGHPIYALTVVLAGLILSTGIGSLLSERLPGPSSLTGRIPAAVTSLACAGYALLAVPVIHANVHHGLAIRALIALALVAPCGVAAGFCFPIGLRWLRVLGHDDRLPWMWALNGAASVLGSFVAIILSMETSITTSALAGSAAYLCAATLLPGAKTLDSARGPV
jgi:hypothetical protein